MRRAPHAGPERSRSARVGVLVLLFVGLAFRLWIASVANNPDGQTLTWGSAFAATGHGDPYREVVAHSDTDPIPLSEIRSLSLAQGYVGMLAGALPLWVGDQIGALELGDTPAGTSMKLGEVFAYKMSYLPADFLILLCIRLLYGRDRRKRLLAVAIWATTPLVIFAYGQGLPDMWTIAFVLLGYLGLRRAATADETRTRTIWYLLSAGTILLGVFGTKLLPGLMLIPWIGLLVADDMLDLRRKLTVGAAAIAAIPVFALPYLLSPFMRTNVFQRFEFELFGATEGFPIAATTPRAQIALILIVGATVWLFMKRRPAERLEGWVVVTFLATALMSGVLSHLMLWVLAPLILLVNRSERVAVFLAGAVGVLTIWHVLTFDWIANLMVYDALDTGSISDWIEANVPLQQVLGALTASAVYVAIGFAVYAYWAPKDWAVDNTRAAVGSMCALPVLVVGAMAASNVLIADSGPTVFSFEDEFAERAEAQGEVTNEATLEFPRFSRWESEPVEVAGDAEANYVLLTVHEESEPSLDDLVVSIVRGGRVLADGEIPLWTAEPQSDRGPVRIDLSRTVSLEGAIVRLERLPEERSEPPTEEPENRPLLRLPAVATPGTGEGVPLIELHRSVASEAADVVRDKMLSPLRLLAVLLASFVLAIPALLIVEPDVRIRISLRDESRR